jgi:hypothetical protein
MADGIFAESDLSPAEALAALDAIWPTRPTRVVISNTDRVVFSRKSAEHNIETEQAQHQTVYVRVSFRHATGQREDYADQAPTLRQVVERLRTRYAATVAKAASEKSAANA